MHISWLTTSESVKTFTSTDIGCRKTCNDCWYFACSRLRSTCSTCSLGKLEHHLIKTHKAAAPQLEARTPAERTYYNRYSHPGGDKVSFERLACICSLSVFCTSAKSLRPPLSCMAYPIQSIYKSPFQHEKGAMPIADQSSHRRLCTIHARAPDVAVVVEPATNNARRLFAGVDIAAPVAVVWDSLTDYDGLGKFIPGRSDVSSVSHIFQFPWK